MRPISSPDPDLLSPPALAHELVAGSRQRDLRSFAGGVAHNLGNQLTVIGANLTYAMRDCVPGHPARKPIEAALAATERLTRMTHGLQMFTGMITEDRRQVDLSEISETVVSRARADLPPTVTIALETRPAVTTGDAFGLTSAISELVANAVEATAAAGGGLVSVSVGTMEMGPSYLTESEIAPVPFTGPALYVEVTDAGRGIDPAIRPRMFDPYATTHLPGRGLGLASVLGTAIAHQAAIHVETSPDGSAVRLVLPVPVPAAAPRQDRGLVLIVDDDARSAALLRTLAMFAGFDVLTASSGEEAIELFPDHTVRLAFIDLALPGMDGLSTADLLRGQAPGLPIVMVTGYEGPIQAEVERRSLRYIQKPLEPEALLALLDSILAS